MTQLTDPDIAPALTRAQLKVLHSLCQGKPSKEIAVDLAISKRTVDYHICCIYKRLKTRNRVQAMRRAQQLGILAAP
jgi:DNA-binding NarL/FixJ family response regulator